jgi:hypothetical protein
MRAVALAAGMNEFLVKPVTLDALAQAVSGNSSAAGTHLFARLRSSEIIVRARSLLQQEWPRLRAETKTALARADRDAPRRLSHYLKSTALLLQDATLLEFCRDLIDGEKALDVILDQIAAHLAAWPAPASSA